MRHSALVLLLLALAGGNVAAQRCLGSNPYQLSHFRFGGGLDIDKYAETYGVELRYSTAGVFGIVEAAMKTWGVETFNDESQLLGATVGVAFPRDGKSRWSVCPMLAFNSTAGPDQAAGIAWHYSEQAFSGAVSVGYLLTQSKAWDVVPTASITVGTTNPTMKTSAGTSLGSYKTFCCGPRGFTTVSLGIGLVLGRTVTLLPSVAFPLDAAGETVYSAHFVFGLGRELTR